jgi:hypothetical protein
MIPVKDHPSNMDRSAKLVTPARRAESIFQVRRGFVAVRADGMANPGHFATETEAEAWLHANPAVGNWPR